MRTLEGGKADGIARWAWQDPAARVRQAMAQVRQIGQDAGPDGQREVGDVLTMLSRLASSVAEPVSLASDPIELRYDPAEKRDTRGRWTLFGGVGQAADVMMKNREGFTVSVRSGGQPVHGYMVAQTGHTHTYPASILDDHYKLTRAIDDMLVSEKEAFRGRGDVYLGGWVHDNKLWLEPSDNIASREQAEHEGRSRNQIAIWDVDNGEEIQTGGHGGGRITEHANPQGSDRPYPRGLPGDGRGGPAGDSRGAGVGHPAGPWPGVGMDTITDQLDLASADPANILGQVLELAASGAWQHERRGPDGKWIGSAQRNPNTSVMQSRALHRAVTANRMSAQQQVAAKVAEDKAHQALEEARAEVERVAAELKQEEQNEENRKHRIKLAVHAALILGGAILAALMAHFDVSPVLASFAGAMPILTMELADWKKKLLWSRPRSRRPRRPAS